MDYFAKAGQVMNLTEHGNSFEIDGSLISGPVLNHAMFGSGVSVFVEVQDSMGYIARRSVINETGSELNQTLRFDFSMFNSVAMSSVERLSVGFEYGGNPYFDTELIYYPPEYRLNSISIVPTPAASALLLAGGLLARRRRN